MAVTDYIYTSAELAEQHVKLAEMQRQEGGVTWGIPEIDRRVLPMRGGDIALLVGRPGDGKTTVLSFLARQECDRIIKRGRSEEETVVYVTLEGTVDSIYAGIVARHGRYSKTDLMWGRVDLDTVKANVVQGGAFPVMFIGFSSLRRSTMVPLSVETMLEAVQCIEEGRGVPKRKVTLLCIDYLQLIPGDETRMLEKVSAAVVGCKNLGIYFDIPVFIGAQAARSVDAKEVKLAELSEIQHSSMAEQHADKVFSLWRPGRTELRYSPGDVINVYGKKFPFSENLLFVALKKQRNEVGHGLWALYMQPEFLHLAALELTYLGRAYD